MDLNAFYYNSPGTKMLSFQTKSYVNKIAGFSFDVFVGGPVSFSFDRVSLLTPVTPWETLLCVVTLSASFFSFLVNHLSC